MRKLHHISLCPFSRTVRLLLAEKNLEFELVSEKAWEERDDFIDMNPAGELPVLLESNGHSICSIYGLPEYLEEQYPASPRLIMGAPFEKAEIRRLSAWIHDKFYREATKKLVYERVLKRYYEKTAPDPKVIRAGTQSLLHHLEYFSWLLDQRDWLAGPQMSLADLALAGHLSTIDFLGGMPFQKYPGLKNWYACLKSRPSFRPLLEDTFPGITPPSDYQNLDF